MALSVGLASAAAWTPVCHGGFVRYVVTAIDVERDGQALTVYTVAARLDGPNDSVILAYRFKSDRPEDLQGFWHCDALSGGLSQTAGSWSPSHFVKPDADRAFDSHVTIGQPAGFNNTTLSDPAWSKGASNPAIGWVRPDIPTNGKVGWYTASAPIGGPGRVGLAQTNPDANYEIAGKPTLENPATDVRLAQFVLSRDHAPREFELTIAFSDGTEGTRQEYATAKFTLGAGKPTQSNSTEDGAATAALKEDSKK